MNTPLHSISALPCGCDPGARYIAEQCRDGCLSDKTPAQKTMQQEAPRQERRGSVRGPTRASTFPTDAAGRKQHPVATGVLDYFPDALVAVAHVSYLGNEQHNPGQALHWAREKSTDEADALLRHFLQRGSLDTDKVRHSAKMAWRALALLQKELEQEGLCG